MTTTPPVNLSDTGGIAVVVLAKDFDIPTEFHFHPQVLPIQAVDLPTDARGVGNAIPTTTKLVLIGGEIPSNRFGPLKTCLNRRALPWQHRRNMMALADALRAAVPGRAVAVAGELEPPVALTATLADAAVKGNGTPSPPAGPKGKGSITEFVKAHCDLGKGSAEEARRLMHLATAQGISTTVGSLAQCISVLKRKGGRTETPKSLMTAQQRALGVLDDALAGLQLVREYVATTEATNIEYSEKLAQLRQLLKV